MTLAWPASAGRASRLLLAAAIALIFAWHVRRHFFLGDDAFVSFRYAHHLADGRGLVWNPGDHVEGYTNFLWVLLMATAIRVGLPPEGTSAALGIASGAGVLVLVWRLTVRTSARPTPLALLAPLALVLSRTFTAWTTGGLETMWFTLLVTASFAALIEERRRGAAPPVASAVLLALAALTRPEGMLFAAVAGAALAVDVGRNRLGRRAFLTWSALVGGVVAAHFLWRRAYHGDWLPNTFAAKVAGAWWEQGLTFAWDFTRAYWVPAFLPLVAWALWRRPDRDRILAATAVAAYALYVVVIGGDRFEFRFWVPVLPLTYWLIADSLARAELPRLAGAAVVAALLGATVHGTLQDDRAQLPRGHGIVPVAEIRKYAARRAAEGRRLRELIDSGVLSPDLVLAVTGAGAVPYYTDWPTVDRHGLNDRYIAHLPLAARGVIAHERDAPKEYLERRGVVIDDALNRLVFEKTRPVPDGVEQLGGTQPLYVADIGDAYLVFASFVPDAEVRRAFSRVAHLTVRGGTRNR